MTTLNLTATDSRQQTVLENLIPMVSDVLAEKINNGVYIEKDGKRLLNKKDLSTFMTFAAEEAKKTLSAANRSGAQSVCVHGDDIMSWAIHYFEEDSIEGKLFNEDGTEYTPPKPVTKKKTVAPTTPVKVEPPKPKQQQASLWDMLDAANKKTVTDQADDHEPVDNADDEDDGEELNSHYTPAEIEEEPELLEQADELTVDEIADALQKAVDEKNGIKKVEPTKKQVPPFYSQYVEQKECYPDCIILIRLGDFYEAFEADAQTLSNELTLTITGRDVGLESRVPMVGFPYHAADTYIAKIRKNHSVVIVEVNGNIVTLKQMGTPLIKDDLPDEDEEEIEELTETEMRQFDGDITEPKVTPLEEPDEDDTALPYSTSSFDKETMIYLYDLLDGKLDIA